MIVHKDPNIKERSTFEGSPDRDLISLSSCARRKSSSVTWISA